MVRLIRLIGAILLIGCFAAEMDAQTPPEDRGSAGQRPAAKAEAKHEVSGATPAKSAYPLDAITDFSAIMVGSAMEIGVGTAEGHIYRSGKLMRMEGPEGHGYFITNLTTLETYGISAGPCIRDTHPFFRAAPFAAARPGYTVDRVPAGKETLDGHSCQVEDITVSSPKPGNPLKMRFWEADDLQGFPIRIDFERAGGKHSTVRYKNVLLGPQDPTLFIYPRSCEVLSEDQEDEEETPKAPAKAVKPPPGDSQR